MNCRRMNRRTRTAGTAITTMVIHQTISIDVARPRYLVGPGVGGFATLGEDRDAGLGHRQEPAGDDISQRTFLVDLQSNIAGLGELTEQRSMVGEDAQLTLGCSGADHLHLPRPDLFFDSYQFDMQLCCHAWLSSQLCVSHSNSCRDNRRGRGPGSGPDPRPRAPT